MQLIPLIYLKNTKAQKPIDTNPAWFREDPVELAKFFLSQGAVSLYINDLNIPPTGKSENLSVVKAIQEGTNLRLWIAGNFRSSAAIESYTEIGADKIVVAAFAYQTPDLFKEACERFPQKMVATIEVRNKHVAIPGMVTPSHKTAFDYASRFEEQGVACIGYADILENTKEFCNHIKVPVLSLHDIQSTTDLEKLFDCEAAGLMGVVLGKSLYENRIDLHGANAFLDDLAAVLAKEPTLTES